MPGRLHLDKDFTAKENVHADIPKKPITDSEGSTSNNLTVRVNNLSSVKGDKEEKETTRMGPLTFEVNPELEEDKHVYLAAVDDQAKLMRWHYRLGRPSPSSSNWRLKVRSLDVWPRSSLLPAWDASLVPWQKYTGEDKRPPWKCLWQQKRGNVSVWINLCQRKWASRPS